MQRESNIEGMQLIWNIRNAIEVVVKQVLTGMWESLALRLGSVAEKTV